MELVLNSRVGLWGVNIALPDHAKAVERLRERFTYDNPVYWDARRFRRPCRHIPRRIELLQGPDSNGAVFGPRGALKDFLRILGELVDLPPIRDETAFPTASIRFAGSLRDYQAAAVEAVVLNRGGVVQAPTGSGKTVVAMALAARLKTPALIMVHTALLLEQTIARVREFLGLEPAVIGAGRDERGLVTIGMVQSLMRRDLDALSDAFGLLVLDEAHHCPAESFKSVIQAFRARYRVGLTATPTRKDRLHPVLFDVVGPIVHVIRPQTLVVRGAIARLEVIQVETEFRAAFRNNYGQLINRLVRDRRRNELLVDTIHRLHAARSLVLSDRVDHCKWLTLRLLEKGMKAEVMTGETPRTDREALLRRFESGEVEVLVSTTALVGEGFDLRAIDTVFLTVPNGNMARTTQVLGRALRPFGGKPCGRVVDFVDLHVSLLRNQFERRMRVYRRFQ